MMKISCYFSVLFFCLFSIPSYGFQGGEDIENLPILLSKEYSIGARHELSLLGTTSVVDKYVKHIGFFAGYTYNFTESIGLEFTGGYLKGDDVSIVKQVRAQGNNSENPSPNLTDLSAMKYAAFIDLQVAPFYGKFSLVSELNLNFNFYGLFGAGLVGTEFKTYGGDYKIGSTNNPVVNNKNILAATIGGGVRLHLTDWFAIKTEIKQIMFRDTVPFYPDYYEKGVDQPGEKTSLSHHTMALAGAVAFF